MSEQETLTLDFIRSLMEPAYMLVWTDYGDNLDNHHGLIQKCFSSKSRERLWEEANVWYNDAGWEAVRGTIAKLKEECTVFNGPGEEDVDNFFDEHKGEIRDEIYSRDDPDMTKELIMHADDIPIRVEMLSNYDYINSHWLELQGGYGYEESYFGDMADSLGSSPTRVKKILTKCGYEVCGRLPNHENWNDRGQVSYEQFYEELTNSCCEVSLLTYIGRTNLRELYKAGFSLEEVVIPEGNCCGFFSSIYSGGSLLGMELKENVGLKLEAKSYHDFRFRLGNKCSRCECPTRHVYGADGPFFGEGMSLVAS